MTPGRAVLLGSLLLSIVLCVPLVADDPQPFTIALALLGAVAAAGLFAPERAGRVLLSLGVLILVTVVPELGLRVAGFTHVSSIQFGYPTPEEFWHLVPDEELFWLLPSEDPEVNSLGFLGDEPRIPKPAGTVRILFLGDSCSQQGYPESYPDIVGHLLRQAGAPVEAVNLSMAGYGSHQGRALAQEHGARLEPDLVVVYYGWNDHWLAYGQIDRNKSGSLRGEKLYRRSRLLQGLRRLTSSLGLARAPRALGVPRVPADHYRENLEAIVARFDVPVILITAPTAHRRLGVPDYLVAKGFASDAGAVLELHQAYNAIVRTVAASSPARLLDLDPEFEASKDLRAMFLEDGIHLTEVGRWRLARRVVDFVTSEELVP